MATNTPHLIPQIEVANIEFSPLDYEGPLFVDDGHDEKGDFEVTEEDRAQRAPSHPGAILRDLFLPRTGLTQTDFADKLGVSRRTVSMIVNESRPITVDMANRLSRALGTSAQFWLSLQMNFDLSEANAQKGAQYEHIERLIAA